MDSDPPLIETDIRPTDEQVDPRRWTALIILLIAAFMSLLDGTIVNVALPSIQRDLHGTYAAIQWTVAGYTLAYAVLLITGGRLGDIFGRKRLFLVGVAGFTLASMLCGLAQDPGTLIALRVLQGGSAALMIPQVLSHIQVAFTAAERPKAFAAYGMLAGLGLILGPVLGGLLIHADLFGWGWRPIFLINVPVGIAALVAAAAIVPDSRSPERVRVDPGGVALVTTSLFLLTYPLIQGRELGWPAWAFVLMALAAPMLVLFSWYERRRTREGRSTLIELGLFRQRRFVVSLMVALVFFIGFGSLLFVLTLFLQYGLGYSALRAGLTLAAFALGLFAISGASDGLAARFGSGAITAGLTTMAAGAAALIAISALAGDGVGSWRLAPGLFVIGMGFGVALPPLADVLLADVTARDTGSVSGLFNTSLQLGAAIGVSLIGVIFFSRLDAQAHVSADVVAPRVHAALQRGGVTPDDQRLVLAGMRLCLHDTLTANDPTATAPSCGRLHDRVARLPADTQARLAAAGATARRHDFRTALEQTLWFEVGAFGLSALLMILLPRGRDSAAAVTE